MKFFEARVKLLSTAASCMASEYHFFHAHPGPNDDAEMEYNDMRLLEAAYDLLALADGRDLSRIVNARRDGDAQQKLGCNNSVPNHDYNCEACKNG